MCGSFGKRLPAKARRHPEEQERLLQRLVGVHMDLSDNNEDGSSSNDDDPSVTDAYIDSQSSTVTGRAKSRQIDFCWARAPRGAPVLCAPIKQSARFDGTQTVAVLLVLSPSSLVSVSHFPLPLSASVSLGLCLLLFFPKLRDLPIGGVSLLTDCRWSISSFSGMVCPVCRCPGAPCVPFLRADEVPEVFDVVVDEDCFRMMANT
ncbi:uncharacterized protein LOC125532664 [Triticum urartu]|uniref:uncharacterized protein LOC125532664 n=1 Tax=Triticum urartu TaxID=4572 RepID=UPI0020441457|nr:uncharacterized protein LOC125532664 [Triticum urartu]